MGAEKSWKCFRFWSLSVFPFWSNPGGPPYNLARVSTNLVVVAANRSRCNMQEIPNNESFWERNSKINVSRSYEMILSTSLFTTTVRNQYIEPPIIRHYYYSYLENLSSRYQFPMTFWPFEDSLPVYFRDYLGTENLDSTQKKSPSGLDSRLPIEPSR